MHYGRQQRWPRHPPETKYWLPILAMSFLASTPILALGSTEPQQQESRQASTQLEKRYTEEEALSAAEAASKAAIDVAVPLAVQAAVAEERGKAAAQQVLDKAAAEALQRQARTWRAVALIATGAGTGALADNSRGALYGAAGGAVSVVVWWIAEHWPQRTDAQPSP
jgi:hypothetical protein